MTVYVIYAKVIISDCRYIRCCIALMPSPKEAVFSTIWQGIVYHHYHHIFAINTSFHPKSCYQFVRDPLLKPHLMWLLKLQDCAL